MWRYPAVPTASLMISAALLMAAANAQPAEDQTLAQVVAGNTEFALDLYARLAGEPGNLFFSPYSISTALAMTYAGAEGETQAQMQEVLHLPPDGMKVHAAYGALLEQLAADPKKSGYTISIANRLWGEERPNYKFAEPFLAITRDYYRSDLANVSFSTDSAGAVRTINEWVARETQKKIPQLLQASDVGPGTTLILTNAIYFKGDWLTQFNKKATEEQPFYLDGGEQTPVPLMRQRSRLPYMETQDFQALQMPYQGRKLSMVVLLPRQRDGLAALEESLTAEKLDEWLKVMGTREVDVYVPRFKLTTGFHLKKPLIEMGMPVAFDSEKAEFGAMIEYTDPSAPQQRLSVSDAIHKAYVDVNEEGTEAAAATGVIIAVESAVPKPPAVFRADHPFVFLIRDNRSGSVLFLGRLANPAE